MPGRRGAHSAWFAVALGMVSGLALVGCSSQENPAAGDVSAPIVSATATPSVEAAPGEGTGTVDADACALLSPEQIGAVTGFEVGPGKPDVALSSGTQSVCTWTIEGDGVSFAQVVVSSVGVAEQRAAAEAFLDGTQDVDIANATDGYVVAGIAGAQVGELFLQVSVSPEDNAAAIELAGQAAVGLGG